LAKSLSYRNSRMAHWNSLANFKPVVSAPAKQYHSLLNEKIKLMVPANKRVLELGSGTGDLLSALNPSLGVGLDFSRSMVSRARQKHPHLSFVLGDVHFPPLQTKFDFVIISDLVNDLWDVQEVLEKLAGLIHDRTRIIMNVYSRVWQFPIFMATTLGMKSKSHEQNWFTTGDLKNLLDLTNFETVKSEAAILIPINIPFIGRLANRILVKLWPFNYFGLTNIIIARPKPSLVSSKTKLNPSVSIIIPARNEAGNIESIFLQTPNLGDQTELIFVEGHSKDNTFEKIQEEMDLHPDRRASLYRQKGIGKANAVKLGFEVAKGDILMILDSDLSVAPADLKRFYDVIRRGQADFVNGVRLVYPMENNSMQYLNLVANKLFSLLFSWLLDQEVKDTLCGTKVIRRSDYEMLIKHWSEMDIQDPFGDFDLLFGASKLSLKIVDLPVRYRMRTYGSTNISRWRHGAMLIRMVFLGAARLKFV